MNKPEKQIEFYHPDDLKHYKFFMENYDIRRIIFGSVKEKLFDNFEKGQITCRFCDKPEGETTFEEETHVIPQLLNRAKPISNFECDECNSRFSRFETDFASYFQLHRAIFGHKKKKSGLAKLKAKSGIQIQGLKKTKDDLKTINLSDKEIEDALDSNMNFVKLLADGDEPEVEIKEDGKILKLTIERPTYTPLNVLKTFLKVGLSIIPQDEFSDYSQIKRLLFENPKSLEEDIYSVFQYSLPRYNSYFKDIFVMHCDRINPELNSAQKMFALFMDNKIIQFPIYSNDDLDRIYGGEDFSNIPIPPLLNPIVIVNKESDLEFHKEFIYLMYITINLNENSKVKGEIDSVTIGNTKANTRYDGITPLS